MNRVPPVAWVSLLAAVLLLPRLGAFGFWEPWEARLAESTSGVAVSPAVAVLLGLGERLGGGEAAARIVFALCGVAAVLAVYWVGAGLFRRRAAVLAAAALVTMPLFSFQARQLLSDMPLVLGLALSLGVARYAWGGGRWLDLAIGVAGMALATASGGALIGVGVPCAAAAGAPGARPAPQPRDRARRGGVAGGGGQPGLDPHRRRLLDHARRRPRLGPPSQTFEWAIRQIGFGLFPWSALAFFALGAPLAGADDERLPPARVCLLLFAGFAFALATVRGLLVGEGRFAALAPIALAIGAFLDEQMERPPERILALLAAVGTVLVGRDLFLEPEDLFSIHTLDKVKWPAMLGGKNLLLGVGIAFALAIGLASGCASASASGRGRGGRRLLAAARPAVVPALSRHLSPRTVVDAYRRAATGGEPLARYRVDSEGSSALRSVAGPALTSPQGVAAHLARPERAFAVIGADDLPPVDEALKVTRTPYAVLDASSSRICCSPTGWPPGRRTRVPCAPSSSCPPARVSARPGRPRGWCARRCSSTPSSSSAPTSRRRCAAPVA